MKTSHSRPISHQFVISFITTVTIHNSFSLPLQAQNSSSRQILCSIVLLPFNLPDWLQGLLNSFSFFLGMSVLTLALCANVCANRAIFLGDIEENKSGCFFIEALCSFMYSIHLLAASFWCHPGSHTENFWPVVILADWSNVTYSLILLSSQISLYSNNSWQRSNEDALKSKKRK